MASFNVNGNNTFGANYESQIGEFFVFCFCFFFPQGNMYCYLKFAMLYKTRNFFTTIRKLFKPKVIDL